MYFIFVFKDLRKIVVAVLYFSVSNSYNVSMCSVGTLILGM